MSWRKEYKAAIQRRLDKVANRKKVDDLINNAFTSGRGNVLQEQHRKQFSQLNQSSLMQNARRRQQMTVAQQQNPLGGPCNLFGSLGLGGLFGGTLHITP